MHAIEPRHESFKTAEFVALARQHGVAIVVAGDSKYPLIADLTAPFVYARIMGTREAEPQGYDAAALDEWAKRARHWASGAAPSGLDYIAEHNRRRRRRATCFSTSSAALRNAIRPPPWR